MKTGLNRLRPRSLKELLLVLATAALGAGTFVVVRTVRHYRNGDWPASDISAAGATGIPHATPRPTAAETAQAAATALTGLTVNPAIYGEQPGEGSGDDPTAGTATGTRDDRP